VARFDTANPISHSFRKVLCALDFGGSTGPTIEAARKIVESSGGKLNPLPSGADAD
jgi:hypothetical protein